MSKEYFENVTKASVRQGLTSFASSKLGMNYVWGGTDDRGYDCSGLIYKAYESQGLSIPRVAQSQYDASIKVSADQLRPGDSVFFSDTGSPGNVTHTGMYIGNGQYIHAANRSDGIITSKLPTGGTYFVGGGRFVGTDGAKGTLTNSNSANLNAALNGLNGVTVNKGGGVSSMTSTGKVPTGTASGGITYSDNLAAALAAMGSTMQIASGGGSVGSIIQAAAGSGDGEGMVYNVGLVDTVTEQLSFKDKILKVIGHILKFITLMMVFVLACVLFMKAFDIKAPKLGGKANV